jgi:hypothetical protein
MIGFLLGTIFGAACILWLAFRLGARKTQQEKDNSGGIHVVSASPANEVENTDKEWLERIFKANERLFELPPHGQA